MNIRRAISLSRSVWLPAALLTSLALLTSDALAQQAPGTPSSVTVTRGDGHLDASWPAVDGAASYHVTYSSDGGANWSLAALNHPDASITIDDVSNGATYVVGVRARNEYGDSGWRNSLPIGPFAPPPPATPTGLTAAAGDGSVTLSWDDPSDSSITGYEYQSRKAPPAAGWGAWTAIPGGGSSTMSHTFTGLTNGTEYRFKLRAVNANGVSSPAPNAGPWYVSATPTSQPPPTPTPTPEAGSLPDAPTGFRLIGGDRAITLTWDAAPDADVTGYEYQQRDVTSGGEWSAWTAIPGSGAGTASFGATGLTNGNEYRFRLRAVNSAGAGPSAPVGDPDYLWEIAGLVSIASHSDYDSDNDRLIEISTVQQLNAIRYDLDGNGLVTGSDATNYQAAFPHTTYTGVTAMGCPNTCQGYELNQHLDFDEDGDGTRDDTYNTGNGWVPIGGATSHSTYNTAFKGNGYVISNLYLQVHTNTKANHWAGLFAHLGASSVVEDFTLDNAHVSLRLQGGQQRNAFAGAVAGQLDSGGRVSRVSVTGYVHAYYDHSNVSDIHSYAGGLIAKNYGTIERGFSSAKVTAEHNHNTTGRRPQALAGGIAGGNLGGSIFASYSTGNVQAFGITDTRAGGIAGRQSSSTGSIKASYSYAKVDTWDTGGTTQGNFLGGGIVGNLEDGAVDAVYAAGEVTGPTKGGVAGNFSGGTLTNAYYDSTVMGTLSGGHGAAKTTTELQSPTAYGTGTSIYKDWNLNLDGVTGNDDPWDFGTSSQYPVLKYKSMSTGQQRGGVTITASPAEIYESVGGPTASTITATLGAVRSSTVTVTLPTSASDYTLSSTTIVIPAGFSSGTATLTAVNNTTDAADLAVDLSTAAVDDRSVTVSAANPTLTIKDDDELAQATGLVVHPRNASAFVTWQPVTGATGYVVQWKSGSDSYSDTTRRAVVSSGATRQAAAASLTNATAYTFRVYATKSGVDDGAASTEVTATPVSTNVDYDKDNDNLIDVVDLAQLNAIRWDLDGNGSSTNAGYSTAFPSAVSGMGCAATCTGYELLADLDFDTNGNGYADSSDSYWSSGRGFSPIGGDTAKFTGRFDGNNDADATGDGGPWAIHNLFIDMEETSTAKVYAGLFGFTQNATIHNVSLYGVSVHGRTTASNNTGKAVAGALVGEQEGGTVANSYAQGQVGAQRTGGSQTNEAIAGGLVGDLADSSTAGGVVRLSAAAVDVTALSSVANVYIYAGGLAGRAIGASGRKAAIEGSYATGDATATASVANVSSDVGGLTAYLEHGDATASYARGDVSFTWISGGAGRVAGLVGQVASTASVLRSYSTGAATASPAITSTCGLACKETTGTTVTDSYWDSTTSGITTTGNEHGGTQKTTSELQTPTSKVGIYANWNDNVDGVTGNDDPWDFGTASQYPVLHEGNLDKADQRKTRLGQVTGLTVRTGAVNSLSISWTAVTGAEGYVLQWKTSSDSFFDASRQRTLTSAAFTHTGLTVAHTYRAFAVKRGEVHGPVSSEVTGTPSTTVDYDSDDDGLIEITKIEQLRAIHYDLNGDGLVTGTDQSKYRAEFPSAVSYTGSTPLGCPSTGCKGYELRANLDFDQDSSYRVAANKTKWTVPSPAVVNREGWWVIGYMDDGVSNSNRGSHVTASEFTGIFDGNNDSDAADGGPYDISNLQIAVLGVAGDCGIGGNGNNYYIGLFGKLGSAGTIRNLTLKNVDVNIESALNTSCPGMKARVGAVVGESAGKVEGVHVTGSVRGDSGNTLYGPFLPTYHNGTLVLGGAVGELASGGSVLYGSSGASVGSSGPYTPVNMGGLVGLANGSVKASYTTGSVGAASTVTNVNTYAGGLVGLLQSSGTVEATYATGAVTAGGSGTRVAGGLVGRQEGTIKYSYSLGTTSGTAQGGLTGAKASSVTTTDAYWDTQTSGDSTSSTGTGKTTAQLQTPTAYGTLTTDIYKDWDIDLDSVTPGTQDPWDFGTSSQYPSLKSGSASSTTPKAQQPPTVTWSSSPATIWESNVGDSTRATSSTLTVTLSEAWTEGITFTLPTPATGATATHTLSATTVTIAAGSTSGTVTLTAVNNKTDAADKTVTLSPTTTDSRFASTGPSVTIRDDDDLSAPVLTLARQTNFISLQATWPEVAGATGYDLEYKLSTASTWTNVSQPSSPQVIGSLTSNAYYDVRVKAQKTGSDDSVWTQASQTPGKDYDVDDDGLIEVSSLAQLNAMRWDLDADGSSTNAGYTTAFPTPAAQMGCNDDETNAANKVCSGYELRANLDFDTDNSGGPNMGDTYYNSGAGWTPIGDGTTAYTGDFDGNNDSDSTGDGGPYTITNLHVNASSTSGTSYAGLFGVIGSGADVDNVALTKVSVTGSTTGDAVYAGALAGKSSGTITESWSLGAVAAKRTGTGTDKTAYAGGLVGWNDGTIRGAYSRAAVTAESHDGNEGYAGGLVGLNDTGDSIAASYAAGSVTANRGTDTTGAPDNDSHAGGLAAVNKGTITASYAIGDGTAVGKNTDMGGLVAENASGATITASYSLGKQTATATGGTATTGGFAGSNSGTITDSYWDTATSGIADDTGNAAPEGKTTSELQTPTTETGIYATWDVNVDGVPGNDDPWDFGTASQYPVLDFGSHVLNKQRNTVTITASPTAIWERADTGLSRVNTSTISAALSHAWEDDLTVTLPSAVAGLYTLSGTAISFTAGSTTASPASVTLTAVDDTVDQTGPDSRTASLATTSVDSHAVAVSTTNVTINDDDNVHKVTGLKLSVDGTKIRVDWTTATGAGGYTLQWHTSDSWASPTGTATISSGNTVTHTISSGLTANTRYYFRVIATKTGELDAPPSDVADVKTHATSPATVDYDADNDGLIEVANLAQLNAIRWDLDGNGVVDSASNATSYSTAFPNAEDNMGCNESAVTITAGPGNPACSGYELSNNLDFDTNSNDKADSGDTYWDSGKGWQPIADMHMGTSHTDADAFTAEFDGNGYIIYNLYVKREAEIVGASGGDPQKVYEYAGLFGDLGSAAKVSDLKLEDVWLDFQGPSTGNPLPHVYAGGLAGRSAGTITGVSITGIVRGVAPLATGTAKPPTVGGLVGYHDGGTITASYAASADVVADQEEQENNTKAYAGGLVGHNKSGTIQASHSAGTSTATIQPNLQTNSAIGYGAYAGGLVGYHESGDIISSYSYSVPTAVNKNANTFNFAKPILTAGGLVGGQAGGNITASYSTGAPTTDKGGATHVTENKGGLVGWRTAGTTTNSYWDTTTSGITAAGQGTGKTTSELQTPTAYGTGSSIYANWDLDLDGVTGNDDPWDFGTASQYPVLKYTGMPADAATQRLVLAQVTGVTASWTLANNVTVSWTAVTGADRYKVQWRESTEAYSVTRQKVASGGSTATINVSTSDGMAIGKTYHIQVIAARVAVLDGDASTETSLNVGNDYDADDDGLIEVDSLARLNAMRWDLDADGSSTNAGYATAFPNPQGNMGCPSTGCTGYELRANLDFNTNDSEATSTNPTGADTGDTYWDGGKGWDPIGGTSGSEYTGSFDGNADTDASGDGGPYTIKNLFIDRTTGNYAGLFANLNGTAHKLVEGVGLVNVDVTLNTTTGAHVYVGGLAGYVGTGGVNIEDSYTTGRVRAGESATDPVTFTAADKSTYAGGLAGFSNQGPILASGSLAHVTSHVKSSSSSPRATVGGLVGGATGTSGESSYFIAASYAGGTVTASSVASTTPSAYAGGLVGDHGGTGGIKSSYARGDASATISSSGSAFAGGLVGMVTGDEVTASYSTGAPTATATTGTITVGGAGGLAGLSGGTITDSYWDTDTSGISTGSYGTGKTTSELQTPTAYGTSTSIYKDWNLNFDGVTGNDDPWDFGTAHQYPTLKYSELTADDQRVKVTLSVSPSTIWERALTTPSRVNASTVTATLDKAWNEPVVVTLPTNAAYSMSATTITIAAGSTTGTATLTAVNNFVDAANNTVTLTQANHPADTKWAYKGTDTSITINDDDELAKPTGVKLSVDGTKIRVDWTVVTGATGYKVQWSTSSTFATKSEATKSSGSTVTHNITSGLTADTRYYVRVLPTKTGGVDEPPSDVVDAKTHATSPATVDYDADNDGLIEVTTLAQLNAIRWDLDGDGVSTNAGYATAFPNAEDNMGCNESVASITAGPGNPACSGYELRANLDFNTNDSEATSTNPTGADTGDTYWNGGLGWDPIGGTSGSQYTGDFDGNADTDSTGDGGPYTIKNLFIDRTSGNYAGLFAHLNGTSQTIENVALVNVDVTFNPSSGSDVYTGGLAGLVDAGVTVEDSYTTGRVRAGESSTVPVTLTASDLKSDVGGLVGRSSGSIISSYSLADVTAHSKSSQTGIATNVGGLVGLASAGSVTASYAGGAVSGNTVAQNNGRVHAGGLVGSNNGPIRASYARGDVSGDYDAGATTSVTGRARVGGLVGWQVANVTASFSTGAPTATGDGTLDAGGLVGRHTGGTNTDSYWDTAASGLADDSDNNSPEGKTTSELQTPTDYGTGANDIYKDWDIDLDTTQTGTQDAWSFGTASQYPVLKYGELTADDQRVKVTLSVSPSTIWERALTTPSRVNASTVTATLDKAWNAPVVVTLPTNAAYTMSPTTITIAAGSTTGTATLTAVNNFVDAANATVTLTQATHPADTKWAYKGADTSITINDDDSLAKPTGVKLSVDGKKIQVDWTAVANADGYKVEWHTSDSWASPTGTATISSGSTVTYKIDPTPALTANTKYYVRVVATSNTAGVDDSPSDAVSATTRASAGTGDYDADNDGLIEITTLAQLNAIRWDLDGNGAVDNATNATSYAAAFPNAEDNMGCNENVATISSGPGNPACSGYELSANLDFDTNNSGYSNAGDTYWNSGQGWLPIGATAGSTASSAYTGDFEGGTYTISNLYINRSGSTTVAHGGLFAQLGSAADVKKLRLDVVSVTVTTDATESTPADVYAGGIAGKSAGSITGSHVIGEVRAVQSENTANNNEKHAYAGGLVGQNTGSITSSYSRVEVTAEQMSTTASLSASAGGIAAHQDTGGSITASFTTGTITADSRSATGASSYAGGLLGYQNAGSVKAVYSHASAEAKTSTTAATATLTAGGLVGHVQAGSITASYSTGAPTTTGGTTPTVRKGGLAGHKNATGTTVTDAYWDTGTSGVTATGAGIGQDHQPVADAHGLRDGRQRHLQGLGPGPGLGDVRDPGPVELRHGDPVPRPEVRPHSRRPARNGDPDRNPRHHLRVHQGERRRRLRLQPGDLHHHLRRRQPGAAGGGCRHPGPVRLRLHPGRRHHNHRRRLHLQHDQRHRHRRQQQDGTRRTTP